jgi:hypothetical protein
MTDIREQIAKYLYEHHHPRIFTTWEELKATYSGSAKSVMQEADSILALIEAAGWMSPEEQSTQNQRDIESERIINREAAYEERSLRAEVEYWKDKDYRLGR